MERHWSAPLPSYTAPVDIPHPNTIPEEVWVAVHDPIREVLDSIRPTMDSQERRKDVTEYMQKLIKSTVGVEVLPYGSVPLKTYLPEGDIDLVVIDDPTWENSLPHEILHVLHAEAQTGNADFPIKEIQFIDAEVKLVKCIVQDIVIDISFNKLSGLCSLCFLEQVDRVVDKDHLFKRSIILIKTWCYYESRILGAYYGFLSTYALEILVLYIFQIFHASLTNPLKVLYMFLSYYSQFDWDNYCISMSGPVIRSLLPQIVVEKPIRRGGLLHQKLLKKCLKMFRVPYDSSEENVRAFTPKHLNIIDPLKPSNNLGRSVNQGNSFHIRSAFRFGAHKLGEILELPVEDIGDGIKNFYVKTLQMHERKPIIFGSLWLSSVSPHNENADLDKYISGLDGEGSTLDLSTGNEFEKGNMDTMTSGDESFLYDGRKKDASVVVPLADLTGDYDSHARNLLYSQLCQGFESYADKFCATTRIALSQPFVPVHRRRRLLFSSCPNCVLLRQPPYVAGHSNTRPGYSFHNTARGTGPFIPSSSSSTKGRERNCEAPLPKRKLQQVRGGTSEDMISCKANNMGPKPSPPQGQRQVNKLERKLMFGSFAMPDVVCTKTGSCWIQAAGAFHLKDEEEFPPLST